MAFTIGRENVLANKREVILSCSVDSASGNIDTGLSVVDGFGGLTPVSMATAAIVLKRNVGSGATSRPGIVNINGAASGDVFFLHVYGR